MCALDCACLYCQTLSADIYSLSLSLSLSLSHTHTHTHTHTARPCQLIYIFSLSLSLSLSRTHIHTHTDTYIYTHIQAHLISRRHESQSAPKGDVRHQNVTSPNLELVTRLQDVIHIEIIDFYRGFDVGCPPPTQTCVCRVCVCMCV